MTLLSHADYERIAANLSYPTEAFIGGTFAPALSGETMPTVNPATGKEIARVASCGREDVDKAVAAARKAFESGAWSRMHPSERKKILMRFIGLIEKHQVELAVLESLDSGKPVRECLLTDLPETIECLEWHAECADKQYGGISPSGDGRLGLIVREPAGVVACVLPWNFPLMMVGWKLGPALAEGNSVILKPASVTSLSTLKLAEFAAEAGIPEGVFNVITGPGSSVGEALGLHPGVDVVSFTGSTEVGLDVAKAAADKLIPSTLELGGKSANIFFEDCDWDRALDGLQLGILFNQGQVCCAGSRVFVQESIYDKFVEAAVKAFNQVNVGDPLDPNTQMGSQVDQGQLKKIMSYVELAKEEGATIACGGEPCKEGACANGAFMKPTLIVNANNSMRVAQEEIFGPVAVVIKFKTEEEVIAMANDSVYGLGGAVWTQDINRAFRVARAIETGRMWVNTYNMIPAGAPFGGYKQSGIGRETHKVILEHYTQQKNIMINLNETPSGFYPAK